MTVAIKTYAETGCPYGDRVRLALAMMDIKFETTSNNALSGTLSFDGSQISGIINIGLTLEANGLEGFFPQNPTKRERQIKLAQLFELKLARLFDDALESGIYRGQGYYMFMESLSVFENELIRCGKFFGGSEIGFLDIVLFPWIARIGIWTS
jgi:glutathione S-transferase